MKNKLLSSHRYFLLAFSAFAVLSCTTLSAETEKATRNVLITAKEEKLRDADGFSAIKSIHAVLDDDQSGTIDRAESADFLTEDLKFGGSDRMRRENAFHNNDESITVDDLWENWFQSEERGWDNKQMVQWLTNQVKLPQYANNFLNSKVTGSELPRIAAQNSSYIVNTLGIKNYVHRQKLQLKALDLVLFGFQDSSSFAKDVTLAALLGLLVTVLIMFKKHKNRSKQQMEELSTVLNKLRDMETDFEGVQNRLEEDTFKRQSNTDDSENIEVEILRNQLRELEERRMTESSGAEGLSYTLQPLLRRTYEIEWAYLYQQKLECLHEMSEAKELVDRMRRKQMSFVNSLKLATGATSGTDDIDNKIFALKARMEKIKMALNECTQRWADIESHCGFSITDPFVMQSISPGVVHTHTQQPQISRTDKARKPTSLPTFNDFPNGYGPSTTVVESKNNSQPYIEREIPSNNQKLSEPQSFPHDFPSALNEGKPKFSLPSEHNQQDNYSVASSSNQSGSIQNNQRGSKSRLSKLFRKVTKN